MINDIIGFVVCAGLITYSGAQLSKQGDRLAEITGLSKAWIGLILMATVTSLPEVATGISSVMVIKSPDLATGNVLGSCAFNLLILSILDLFLQKPLTGLVKTSHVLTGAFSIILMCLAGAGILLPNIFIHNFWIAPMSIIIMAVYAIAVRGIFLYEKNLPIDAVIFQENNTDKSDLKKVISIYGINAIIVVLAALFLPYFGENIATQTGLSESFFGTVFLAITTSLPEVVVSISALRLGSLDMAIGNLLGSNLFNIAILSLLDIFYFTAPIFTSISSSHLVSVFSSIMMTAVVTIGMMVKPQTKTWKLSLDTWVILLIYLITLLLIHD